MFGVKEQMSLLCICLYIVKVYGEGCPFASSANDEKKLLDQANVKDVDYHKLLQKGRQVTPNSLKMSRRNIFVDKTVNRLVKKGYSRDSAHQKVIQLIKDIEYELEECKGTMPDCDPNMKYRMMNGQCNNPVNPLFGSQRYRLQRFLPPKYEDAESNPTENSQFKAREGCISSGPLPNARKVSSTVHTDVDVPSTIASTMVSQWGMFVAHDLSFVPNSHEAKCCEGAKDDRCLPIRIYENDLFYSNFNVTCLNFYRSVRFCSSTPREQYNEITSFIDASNVYGSSDEELLLLKEENSYLMKSTLTDDGKELLPKDGKGSFVGGDARALLTTGLASVHTLFVREHNRISRKLAQMNPSYTNETVFQETRRILGAKMQNIVYSEFLPTLLGEKSMNESGLNLKYPSSYHEEINPTVASVFVAAAYRFGHSMIQRNVNRLAIKKYSYSSNYSLFKDFFNTANYEDRNGLGIEEILYGLTYFPAQSADRFVVKEVTNYLFNNGKPYGADLEAKTILRGRDHGLPSYGDWREFCGLEPLCDWNNKPTEISENIWLLLKELYSSPNDIDIHTAGLAETPIPHSVLGPTNNCIIGRQFTALKDGDRFFFTHDGEAGSFTPKQVKALRQTSLSRVMCDNTGIDKISVNVFRTDSQFVPCSSLPELNLNLF